MFSFSFVLIIFKQQPYAFPWHYICALTRLSKTRRTEHLVKPHLDIHFIPFIKAYHKLHSTYVRTDIDVNCGLVCALKDIACNFNLVGIYDISGWSLNGSIKSKRLYVMYVCKNHTV